MPRLIADREILHTTSELAQVMASAAGREAEGERILHLERGEPDFDTPRHIVEALALAVRRGDATHYPDPCGTLTLRVALTDKLAGANGIECHPEDVVVTAGATQALYMAFHALLAPGDEILLFSPYWMMVPRMIGLAGARLRAFPAYLDLMEGALTASELAERLRAALRPETRGFYLNTPNNPSGAVLAREHLEAIAAVAIERDLWVVSDEAYEHILFDGAQHVSIASLPGMAARTVSVFTFSKSYAMTGWRLGYLAAPPPLRPVLGPTLGALTTYGVFPGVQSAGLAALRGPQRQVEAMRRAYEERRDALLAGLEGQSALRVPRPGGAFYAFPDVSAALEGGTDWDLVREWLDLGLAVLPGSAFGPHPDRVRLSLATRREDVIEAARRLRERYARSKRRTD